MHALLCVLNLFVCDRLRWVPETILSCHCVALELYGSEGWLHSFAFFESLLF